MFGLDDAVGAAAIIGASNLLGGHMTNQQTAANAESANRTSIWLAGNAFQRRTADLTAAGLNPMLAYTQGPAAVPNMQVPHVTNTVANSANSAVAGYTAAKGAELINSQVVTQQTQQEVNKAMALKAVADADVSVATASEIRARTPMYGPMITEINHRIDKIAADTGLSFAQTLLVKRQAANAVLQGENIQADTGNIKADTMLKFVTKDLNAYRLNRARNESDFADTWFGRNIAPTLPSLLDISDIYGNLRPRGGGITINKSK